MVNPMEFDAIAVFVKVVEAGSFAEAARRMKLPKTTVSAKVAALEKRLGTRLIQRTTRALRVTEAGQEFFHHCANALRQVELGESAVASRQARPSGLLRITAPVGLGRMFLPEITHAYLDAYPDMDVEMLITNRVLDLVQEGVDLAIRPGHLRDSSLVARRFFDVGVSLWAAPAYLERAGPPGRPQDLPRHRLVGHTLFRSATLSDGRASVEVTVDGRVRSDDFDTLKDLLILGGGIGWLPDCLAQDAAAAGTLVPVLPGWKSGLASRIYFVYPGRRYPAPKVRAFIETALATISTVCERPPHQSTAPMPRDGWYV
jgi:DNA-binding transcriptional LysR family regulator